MQPIRFRCLDCRQALKVDAGKTGRKVRCNRCGKALVVLAADAAEVVKVKAGLEPDPSTKMTWPSQRVGQDLPLEDAPTEREDGEREGDPKQNHRRWRPARLGVLVLLVGTALTLLNMAAWPLYRLVLFRLDSVRSPESLVLASVGTLAACALIKIVGFVLCLFTPAPAGARRFAAVALAATLLSSSVTAVSAAGTLSVISHSRSGFSVENEVIRYQPRDKQDSLQGEDSYQGILQRMQQVIEEHNALMRRQSILRTLSSLLQGLYLISLPLLLRAFCRARSLNDLEPACERLLTFGAGVIAIDLVVRLAWLLAWVPSSPSLSISALLVMLIALAYEAFSVVLLSRIWRALARDQPA